MSRSGRNLLTNPRLMGDCRDVFRTVPLTFFAPRGLAAEALSLNTPVREGSFSIMRPWCKCTSGDARGERVSAPVSRTNFTARLDMRRRVRVRQHACCDPTLINTPITPPSPERFAPSSRPSQPGQAVCETLPAPDRHSGDRQLPLIRQVPFVPRLYP